MSQTRALVAKMSATVREIDAQLAAASVTSADATDLLRQRAQNLVDIEILEILLEMRAMASDHGENQPGSRNDFQ